MSCAFLAACSGIVAFLIGAWYADVTADRIRRQTAVKILASIERHRKDRT